MNMTLIAGVPFDSSSRHWQREQRFAPTSSTFPKTLKPANCDFSRHDSSPLRLQSQLAAEETLKNCRQRLFGKLRGPEEFAHVASVKEEKERAAATPVFHSEFASRSKFIIWEFRRTCWKYMVKLCHRDATRRQHPPLRDYGERYFIYETRSLSPMASRSSKSRL